LHRRHRERTSCRAGGQLVVQGKVGDQLERHRRRSSCGRGSHCRGLVLPVLALRSLPCRPLSESVSQICCT
jgi:hypothetical protein